MEVLLVSNILLSFSFVFLFLRERLRFHKYKTLIKDLTKACFTYVNTNEASVIVKNIKGDIVFSTKKQLIQELDKIKNDRISSLEITLENEIKVNGVVSNTIEIIEKFCQYQNDSPQTGFVKVNDDLYFFLSKRLCFGKDNYYLYLYQKERLMDLEKIINAAKNIKGISFATYKTSLIIFRSDEDFKVLKDTIMVKC